MMKKPRSQKTFIVLTLVLFGISAAFVSAQDTLVASYTFDEGTEGWSSGSPDEFTTPAFSYVPLKGALAITATDNDNQYGYWRNLGTDIEIQSGKDYLVEYMISSNQTNPTVVPTVRMVVISEDSQSGAYGVVNSNLISSDSPTSPTARQYLVHFTAPTEVVPEFNGLITYFEILNFGGSDSDSATLFLEEVNIWGMDLDAPTTPTL